MRYHVNIRREYYGYNVAVWDDADQMYPLAYNQKYIGYTLQEVKRLVRERHGLQHKHIEWYGSAVEA